MKNKISIIYLALQYIKMAEDMREHVMSIYNIICDSENITWW
jgi:hypothetical protein